MSNYEVRRVDNLTREVACPRCGSLTFATFPSSCPRDRDFIFSECRCRSCDCSFEARKYPDGAETVRY